MKLFYTKDFFSLLTEEGWLEEFVDFGYCWDGCRTKYPIKISDFLMITLGYIDKSTPQVHAKLRVLLNDRELKGKNVFYLPEQIAWCQCEPRHTKHQHLKAEFFDLLYKKHESSKSY